MSSSALCHWFTQSRATARPASAACHHSRRAHVEPAAADGADRGSRHDNGQRRRDSERRRVPAPRVNDIASNEGDYTPCQPTGGQDDAEPVEGPHERQVRDADERHDHHRPGAGDGERGERLKAVDGLPGDDPDGVLDVHEQASCIAARAYRSSRLTPSAGVNPGEWQVTAEIVPRRPARAAGARRGVPDKPVPLQAGRVVVANASAPLPACRSHTGLAAMKLVRSLYAAVAGARPPPAPMAPARRLVHGRSRSPDRGPERPDVTWETTCDCCPAASRSCTCRQGCPSPPVAPGSSGSSTKARRCTGSAAAWAIALGARWMRHGVIGSACCYDVVS